MKKTVGSTNKSPGNESTDDGNGRISPMSGSVNFENDTKSLSTEASTNKQTASSSHEACSDCDNHENASHDFTPNDFDDYYQYQHMMMVPTPILTLTLTIILKIN